MHSVRLIGVNSDELMGHIEVEHYTKGMKSEDSLRLCRAIAWGQLL
jgi:hypothetical protein